MNPPAVLVVTGASGSGKTASVRALGERARPGIGCHHFDSVGVPSIEEMQREHGSPESWQRATTERWLRRFEQNTHRMDAHVLDGQTRPSYVLQAARGLCLRRVDVVVLDCATEVRHARLAGPRAQPDLVNARMDAWAAYLRGQADALEIPVVDTTEMSIEAVADRLLGLVESVRRA